MSWFNRLFSNATLQEPEWWKQSLFDRNGSAGVSVSIDNAMQVSAVFACVRILSEGVASLPLKLYRRNPDGSKELATDHPLYSILHSTPNNEQTAFDLREFQMVHLGMRGNAYCQVNRDGRGRIGEILPLDSQYMKLDRNASGQLIFHYDDNSTKRTFNRDQIWRIGGTGTNGVTGLSPIGLARESIGLAIATERHGGSLFKNGAQVPQVLEHPHEMSDEAYDRLKKSINEKHGGVENAHKMMILEGGSKLSSVGMTNEDSQFLQSRKFQIAEIARWYRVPLHMLNELDKATFSNIEHQSLEFVIHTLRPWLTRIEQTINRDLLLPSERGTYFAEHSVEGLLRGDTKSRYEAYGKAINDGWINRNEVRGFENLNPVDGLDEYLVPMNMAGANQADQTSETVNDLVHREIKAAASESVTKNKEQMVKWAKGFYSRHLNKAAERLDINAEKLAGYADMRIKQLTQADDIAALINGWRDTAANEMRSFT